MRSFFILAAIVAVSIYLAMIVAKQGFGLDGFYALMFGTVVAGIICAILCVIVEKTFKVSIFPAPQIQDAPEEENQDDN